MAFVGLIYLGFENYLQSQLGALVQKPGDASRPVLDRAVTGAQVRSLIATCTLGMGS